jgi:hypothetical protein
LRSRIEANKIEELHDRSMAPADHECKNKNLNLIRSLSTSAANLRSGDAIYAEEAFARRLRLDRAPIGKAVYLPANSKIITALCQTTKTRL